MYLMYLFKCTCFYSKLLFKSLQVAITITERAETHKIFFCLFKIYFFNYNFQKITWQYFCLHASPYRILNNVFGGKSIFTNFSLNFRGTRVNLNQISERKMFQIHHQQLFFLYFYDEVVRYHFYSKILIRNTFNLVEINFHFMEVKSKIEKYANQFLVFICQCSVINPLVTKSL